jgi:hypothetical protein
MIGQSLVAGEQGCAQMRLEVSDAQEKTSSLLHTLSYKISRSYFGL